MNVKLGLSSWDPGPRGCWAGRTPPGQSGWTEGTAGKGLWASGCPLWQGSGFGGTDVQPRRDPFLLWGRGLCTRFDRDLSRLHEPHTLGRIKSTEQKAKSQFPFGGLVGPPLTCTGTAIDSTRLFQGLWPTLFILFTIPGPCSAGEDTDATRDKETKRCPRSRGQQMVDPG